MCATTMLAVAVPVVRRALSVPGRERGNGSRRAGAKGGGAASRRFAAALFGTLLPLCLGSAEGAQGGGGARRAAAAALPGRQSCLEEALHGLRRF